MGSCFSGENLEALRNGHNEVAWKCECLAGSYVTRNYKNLRAREYAQHGFSRRIKTMARCIDNVFRILPPDGVELPTNNEILDSMINIQAFVFNAFGSIDNLAWIWVLERGVTQKGGSPIPDKWVGLRKNNKDVRRSFSTEFQEYLGGLEPWFRNLDDFRHALAHRIPLFIPPYTVPTDNQLAYQQLEQQIEKTRNRMNFAERKPLFEELNRLRAEQRALATFFPMMMHSIEEQSRQVWLHRQLLSDFCTIEEIAQKMLRELELLDSA
jgi:hypothetical protein